MDQLQANEAVTPNGLVLPLACWPPDAHSVFFRLQSSTDVALGMAYSDASGIAQPKRPPPKSVLLIESDGVLLGLMDRALRDWGVAQTLLFRDGASALALARLDRVDCALVDLASANGEASAVISTLRMAGVPFAVLLGTADETPALSQYSVLVKPFSDDDLIACLFRITSPTWKRAQV